MTFSEQVKQEIVNLTFNDNQLKALLSSFITNALSMSITNSQTVWELKSQSAQTIRFLTNNLSKLFGLKYQLSYTANSSKNQKRIYKLSIFDQFEVLTKQLELFNKPKKIISNETSKRAYLAGAFLSDGSISSLEKSQYHLELGSNNLEYLRILQSLLVKYHISMTLMKRKYDYCLYLKKSEAISDFLKVIGANEAMTQ